MKTLKRTESEYKQKKRLVGTSCEEEASSIEMKENRILNFPNGQSTAMDFDSRREFSMYDIHECSSLFDSLSMSSSDDKAGGTDDMNEMDMPNPGSIQHFQRLFYPTVPCKNCASCYYKFTEEIFGD